MPQVTDCHIKYINHSESYPKVVVAAGSNMSNQTGSPVQILDEAFASFGDSPLSLVQKSLYYQTPSFPAGAGPDYVNAVIVLSGLKNPNEILKTLHNVESIYGRTRETRWGQRTLDLDLISVGDQVMPDMATFEAWRDLPMSQQINRAPEQLILPHPRVQDRAFVLIPLADVDPDWIHPVSGLSVQQLLDALPETDKSEVKRL